MPAARAAAERRYRTIVAAALSAFVVLAALLAFTRPPQGDEGHFANAGAALAADGRFVMPMWTEWIATLDQRVYSNMPLYFLALGGWFKAFGVSWWSMRALSIGLGVALVVSLVSIARSISRDRATAVAALLLVALSYEIVNFSSARYDVMTAALSAAALASYLTLRERSLGRALGVANALQAAACLTHPYAIFGMLGLAVFALSLDWRRLRARHVALAALPYAVAAGAWGAYIAQDVAMFRDQFGTNASGRMAGASNPLAMIWSDVRDRYVGRFAGWRPGAPAVMRVKILLLLAYVGGVVVCIASPAIRANRAARALVAHAIGSVVLLALIDATKWYVYLIYVVPVLTLCLALAAGAWYRAGGWRRHAVRGGLAAYGLFGVASVAYRVRLDVHHRAYLPAARYLQRQVRPGDLVMAGGEFGLELGFARHVLDDPLLGFRNGRVPDYFVISTATRETLDEATPRDSALARHVAATLGRYRRVFASSAGGVDYEVYAR